VNKGFVPYLALLAVVLSLTCKPAPVKVSIEWIEADGYRSRPLSYEGVAKGQFTPVRLAISGIEAATSISDERRLENRTLVNGTGVALGDVDGDGWVDIYLCLLDQPNVLYRNLGGWRFEDVTQTSSTGLSGRLSRGAVFADADGDGDLDLFVSVHAGSNTLLFNDGTGVFEERSVGFEPQYGTNTLALADIDGDADLDAYFTNYKNIQGDDLFSPAERNLRGYVQRVGDELIVSPPYDAHYRLQLVGDRSLRFELADPDEFYLNDGSGHFTLVDMTQGMFRTAAGVPIAETPRDWGLVARFFDSDDDGDPDLYVANDFGSRDGFWINQGGWFRAASGLELRTTSASSMGVDFSDVDGDGDTDFITTEMLARDQIRRRGQAVGTVVQRTPPGRADMRAPTGRNTLQLNRGDGTFAEVGRGAGIAASDWTWGAMFLDVDLDGYEDLLVTNGHAWDPLDGDTQEALRTGQIQVDWRRELGVFPTLDVRNIAFRNTGDGTFEVADSWAYGTEPNVSHGIASADLDRDGDRDLVITRLDERPLILRNDAGRPRISVRVLDRSGNTQAIGARAVLKGGATPRQTRQITSGGMYLSASDPSLTFAMGTSNAAELVITWPSGIKKEMNVEVDNAYEVFPPSILPVTHDSEVLRPLFSGPMGGGRHIESEFDELARQPLIPVELSRLGPGLSWEDVDRDGDPDLLIASATGGQTLLMRTERRRLLAPIGVGSKAPGDQTGILAVPTVEGTNLIAGVSNWEVRTPSEIATIPSVMLISQGPDLKIPASTSATGPLALADIDGDDDLDLFLGGRAIPGAYPLPSSSRMFRNEDGEWVEDSVATDVLDGIGLVSGAVFSDVDIDGDPDLILAIEWGPVRLLRNDGGQFSEVTDGWGLGTLPGRWNGIATGDLNSDGLPDLVVTNWGRNTGHTPTLRRPIRIHAADLDGNGLTDIIESETDSSGAVVPIRGYSALSATLPFIRRAAPTYGTFARATVDQLLGVGRTNIYEAEVVTLDHTLFLNVGGSFQAHPLPPATQHAPAFGVVIADFDRDGAEDLFVAQNFFATPEGVSRHDAGRGELLLGNGEGDLLRLGADRSGIAIYGDARGAAIADFDADGRWDLAVGQNGEEVAIFQGAGGTPGLRVRLVGTGLNPEAVGASVRIVYDSGWGPLREIQAGSGYWSKNDVVQVFGLREPAQGLRVRWPDGSEETYDVRPNTREIVVRPGEGR